MKIRTYKTIIRPRILYGSETWTITGKMACTLMTWQNKDFEENLWTEKRTRGNPEIQNTYESPDEVTEFKLRRLEWLGHVVRMEDTRLPKMVFNAKPEGRCWSRKT
jgi:hypothetical protein